MDNESIQHEKMGMMYVRVALIERRIIEFLNKEETTINIEIIT